MKIKQAIMIGKMDNTLDHTFESANRVYFRGGVVRQFQLVQVVTFNQKQ